MKALFSALLIITPSFLFAGSDSLQKCEKPAINNVKEIVLNDEATEALHLNGAATVTFSVDENNTVHVESIQSSEYAVAFHIKHSLEGAVVCPDGSLAGKTFTIVIEFGKQTTVRSF